MIVRKTFEALKAALEPARDQMDFKVPQITVVDTGHYSVSGSRGFYKVTCGRTRNGSFYVDCLCKAGQVHKPCYHAVCAFDRHVQIKIIENIRRQQELQRELRTMREN